MSKIKKTKYICIYSRNGGCIDVNLEDNFDIVYLTTGIKEIKDNLVISGTIDKVYLLLEVKELPTKIFITNKFSFIHQFLIDLIYKLKACYKIFFTKIEVN